MDIEFHYYIMHLLTARAGFSDEEVRIIAYSSQYTDDNVFVLKIHIDTEYEYSNFISQTMNIFNPPKVLLRIYPLFHFIPGDTGANTAFRKDGKLHLLNTTPDSKNANLILDQAIKSENPYRIGIASHAYADTFAHQNFIGYFDWMNDFEGIIEKAIPKIGHACAEHKPDWPGLIWQDVRLFEPISIISNKERFIEAAIRLYEKLKRFKAFETNEDLINKEKDQLKADLDWAIGHEDSENLKRGERIERYLALSKREEYRGIEIEEYDRDKWLDSAVSEEIRGLRDRDFSLIDFPTIFKDIYTWKDINSYKSSDWYQFQEAVKRHQSEAWAILERSTFATMELSNL